MKLKSSVFVFTAIFSVAISGFSQTAQPTPPVVEDDGEVIKIDSRLVVVPVSVLDANGQAVIGLKEQDFRILEDGKTQEVSQISNAEKVPLEIALLFDVSASTDSMFRFEQETAAQFLKDVMRPEDRATIFSIGEGPRLINARDEADKSAAAINSIQPTKSFTAFYDSVAAAALYLQKKCADGQAQSRRRYFGRRRYEQ